MNRPGAMLGRWARWLGATPVACTGWVANAGAPLDPPLDPPLAPPGPPPGPPSGFLVAVAACVPVPAPCVGPPVVPPADPGAPLPTTGPPGDARSAPQWGQNRKSGGT